MFSPVLPPEVDVLNCFFPLDLLRLLSLSLSPTDKVTVLAALAGGLGGGMITGSGCLMTIGCFCCGGGLGPLKPGNRYIDFKFQLDVYKENRELSRYLTCLRSS